jgi:hypothetical protein
VCSAGLRAVRERGGAAAGDLHGRPAVGAAVADPVAPAAASLSRHAATRCPHSDFACTFKRRWRKRGEA